MKPASFEYARPSTLAEALALVQGNPEAKVLAGGQTLGPMLNLRLARPSLLVDITRLPELARVEEDDTSITLGASITHAAIEDGRVKDFTRGFLARVAAGIAYRAVRTRGTIGGSLAHADPAADWLSCLTAMGAELELAKADGRRRVPLSGFVLGAMQTKLEYAELIVGVRIPKLSARATFGFHKICRKMGEFADAIGVAVSDPERGSRRLVASSVAGSPIVLDESGSNSSAIPDVLGLERRLSEAGFAGDAYEMRLRSVALQRAMKASGMP